MKLGGKLLPKALRALVRPHAPARARPPTNTPVRLRLPLPPSTNDMWTIGVVAGKHRVVSSAAANAYKDTVARVIMNRCRPIEAEVIFELVVHFREGDSTSDTGNRMKVLEDALQGACYSNDVQVAEIHLVRGQRVPIHAYVDVQVSPWRPSKDLLARVRHVPHDLGLWATPDSSLI